MADAHVEPNCEANPPRVECDPARRHEPEERLDDDNVTGDPNEIQLLDLPEPPKSGFRIVVPAVELGPNAEREGCFAWPYPEFTHRQVYAARIYATSGLHHSNLYGVPLSDEGPSPYPDCGEGQASVAAQLPNILSGNIMDVLFANSTQIVGGEALVLPEGMAFEITTEGREITTDIHWLNTSNQPLRVEIVYDLFTMPEEDVEHHLVPYYFDNFEFEIPPNTSRDIVTECEIFGGNIVTMMSHNHERTVGVTVDLMGDGDPSRVLDDGAFDLSSDIAVFETPLALDGFQRIRHTCTVENDLDLPIVWGIGTNEMCTLFGYMYPPSAQVMGVVQEGQDTCTSVNIGANR